MCTKSAPAALLLFTTPVLQQKSQHVPDCRGVILYGKASVPICIYPLCQHYSQCRCCFTYRRIYPSWRNAVYPRPSGQAYSHCLANSMSASGYDRSFISLFHIPSLCQVLCPMVFHSITHTFYFKICLHLTTATPIMITYPINDSNVGSSPRNSIPRIAAKMT